MKVANFSAPSKVCAVVLDEMTIKEGLSYNPRRDEVEGNEDFGYFGRTAFIANHAIVFLVRGCTTSGNSQLDISYLFAYNEQVNNDRFRRTAYRQFMHWRFDRPSRAIG